MLARLVINHAGLGSTTRKAIRRGEFLIHAVVGWKAEHGLGGRRSTQIDGSTASLRSTEQEPTHSSEADEREETKRRTASPPIRSYEVHERIHRLVRHHVGLIGHFTVCCIMGPWTVYCIFFGSTAHGCRAMAIPATDARAYVPAPPRGDTNPCVFFSPCVV